MSCEAAVVVECCDREGRVCYTICFWALRSFDAAIILKLHRPGLKNLPSRRPFLFTFIPQYSSTRSSFLPALHKFFVRVHQSSSLYFQT
jgi:hypothetical protein